MLYNSGCVITGVDNWRFTYSQTSKDIQTERPGMEETEKLERGENREEERRRRGERGGGKRMLEEEKRQRDRSGGRRHKERSEKKNEKTGGSFKNLQLKRGRVGSEQGHSQKIWVWLHFFPSCNLNKSRSLSPSELIQLKQIIFGYLRKKEAKGKMKIRTHIKKNRKNQKSIGRK
jgi:hypothetical protein